MPISAKISNQTETDSEPIEAELVEETDVMYAATPTPTPEGSITCSLRSLIPQNSQDHQAGFKLLTTEEVAEYTIPDRSLFRVREDAGKLLNLSSQRVGQHIKELQQLSPAFPRNYLIDEEGITPECLWELFKKVEFTAKNILPGNPADWRSLKKSKKEFNPKWKTHRFAYNSEHNDRIRDYYAWLDIQPQPEVEVHTAEFVPDEPPEDRQERMSRTRGAIQLLERRDEQIVRELCRLRRERLILIVEEEELETRLVIEQKREEVLRAPDITQQLEEDEDL